MHWLDGVVASHGGIGTANMVTQAEARYARMVPSQD
jgi:hypothetical protein